MRRVLIIAGGTGGHIFPGMAVAERLQESGVQVFWLGTKGGMETKLVAPVYSMATISVSGLRGKGLLTWLAAPWRLCRALVQAYRTIRGMRPDVVLGMGGFVCGPGCLAAAILGIPVVIHEQNAVAGTTNRLLTRIARRVLCAFPDAFSKAVDATVLGNPLRASLLQVVPPEKRFSQRDLPLRVLIVGGSRGAHALNETVMRAVLNFPDREQLLLWHQTGEADAEHVRATYANVSSQYRAVPFIENMNEAYLWADVVICRAGALTVSELAMVGVGSVLVPFPHATDDHQFYNAQQLASVGAAIVIRQPDFTEARLIDLWETFIREPDKLHQMGVAAKQKAMPRATTQVLGVCESVVKK